MRQRLREVQRAVLVYGEWAMVGAVGLRADPTGEGLDVAVAQSGLVVAHAQEAA